MKKEKFVYLLCDPANNLYKIGFTTSTIKQRIQELLTGNATEIHIVNYHVTDYPRMVEKMLHTKFGHKRILNEWFLLCLDDITSFNNICLNIEETIKTMKDNPFFAKELK